MKHGFLYKKWAIEIWSGWRSLHSPVVFISEFIGLQQGHISTSLPVLDVTFHSVFGHIMSNVLNNTYARYHSYTRHVGIPVRTHNRRTSTPKQHRPLYGRWRQWHGHLIWASVLLARCHCLWRSRPRVVLSWLTWCCLMLASAFGSLGADKNNRVNPPISVSNKVVATIVINNQISTS